ncbi:MAG TPA: restriction endonuclease subunit S [Tepidisphaeraceae bacterium]|nr:restriction endonuclease subunit S [Tepidisphaeraceae bacterium]
MRVGLPKNWRLTSFREVLVGNVRNGIYKSNEHHGRGAKIVNMGELFAHPRLRAIPMRRVAADATEQERFGLRPFDLIFARRSLVAEGAGKCSIIMEVAEPTVFESSIIRARPDTTRADPLFLYYLWSSPVGTNLLRTILRQVAVAGITGKDLEQLEFVLPPLPEQRAIAGVLGSLDDKIDQNRRTAGALERLARAIFRAWFVDFEPVKAKAAGATAFPSMPSDVFAGLPSRFVDSEIGAIPEGWKAGKLGDIASERRDGVQPADIDPATPYIGLEHMPRTSVALHEWEHAGKVTSGKARFSKNDVLFGKLRPYFHKVGVAPIDGVCSTDIVVMQPKHADWFGLLLGHVSSDDFVAYTNAASTGTKMPRTNWGDMSRYPIGLPPIDITRRYSGLAESFVEAIIHGIFESRKLAELRDYLLPRLLSGTVRLNGHAT